jgi:hypothetical protein
MPTLRALRSEDMAGDGVDIGLMEGLDGGVAKGLSRERLEGLMGSAERV